jgi:hypothetical protein
MVSDVGNKQAVFLVLDPQDLHVLKHRERGERFPKNAYIFLSANDLSLLCHFLDEMRDVEGAEDGW